MSEWDPEKGCYSFKVIIRIGDQASSTYSAVICITLYITSAIFGQGPRNKVKYYSDITLRYEEINIGEQFLNLQLSFVLF